MRYIYLFILSFLLNSINAQTVREGFSGYGTIDSVSLISGTTYSFVIKNFQGNERPRQQDSYTTLDVLPGFVLWSTDCNRFVVSSIISADGIKLKGTFINLDVLQAPPTNNTRVTLLRETVINGFIAYSLPPAGDGNGGAINGISINNKVCIEAHYRRQDSVAFSTVKEITEYAGFNGTVPAFTPSSTEPRIAKPRSGNEIYTYDGSAWYLVGGSSSGTNILPLNNTFTGKNNFMDSVYMNKGLRSNGLIDTKGLKSTGSSGSAATTINGVQQEAIVELTASTLLDGTYNTIIGNPLTNDITLTLPTINLTNSGWKYVIRKKQDSMYNVIITGLDFNHVIMSPGYSITIRQQNGTWISE